MRKRKRKSMKKSQSKNASFAEQIQLNLQVQTLFQQKFLYLIVHSDHIFYLLDHPDSALTIEEVSDLFFDSQSFLDQPSYHLLMEEMKRFPLSESLNIDHQVKYFMRLLHLEYQYLANSFAYLRELKYDPFFLGNEYQKAEEMITKKVYYLQLMEEIIIEDMVASIQLGPYLDLAHSDGFVLPLQDWMMILAKLPHEVIFQKHLVTNSYLSTIFINSSIILNHQFIDMMFEKLYDFAERKEMLEQKKMLLQAKAK